MCLYIDLKLIWVILSVRIFSLLTEPCPFLIYHFLLTIQWQNENGGVGQLFECKLCFYLSTTITLDNYFKMQVTFICLT